MKKPYLPLVLAFAFFTGLLRIAGATLPLFPMGFSPMQSLALFSPRLLRFSWLAFSFPLLVLMCSDSLVNFYFTRNFSPFYPGFYWQYLSFLLVSLLGQCCLNTQSLRSTLVNSLGAATLFYVISNLGVWLSTSLYPSNLQGFITCYSLALPFYLKDLCANFLFSGLIYTILSQTEKNQGPISSLNISLR